MLERAGKNYRVRRVGSLNNLFVLENPTKLARCTMISLDVRLVSDRESRRKRLRTREQDMAYEETKGELEKGDSGDKQRRGS